jgi:geranylgeranyl diphosphate synthase, type II
VVTLLDIEARLALYRDLTADYIRALVPTREPRRYLYDLVAGQLGQAGKGLRPALCLATCRAFGGDVRDALPSAAALELLHNAFLVHDDIEDGSLYRRDRPTLHAQYGIPIALNVGDAMIALALSPLLDSRRGLGARLAGRLAQEFAYMLQQALEGQAIELGWVRDNTWSLTEADYLRMVLKKTGWYTVIQPCRIGALVATRGGVNLERFNRFGCYLGAAFQIQDDLLNLLGERRRYGKEILGDLWEGKRSLPLIHLLRSCTEDERSRLLAFLASPRERRTEREVRWVRALMERYASLDYARESARQLAEAARREAGVAYQVAPVAEEAAFIRDLIAYCVEREV